MKIGNSRFKNFRENKNLPNAEQKVKILHMNSRWPYGFKYKHVFIKNITVSNVLCSRGRVTDLFPAPPGGSDVLDLFLLSESSDRAEGFTPALQPWVLACRRAALRSGQSVHYWVSAVSSVPRAEAAVT